MMNFKILDACTLHGELKGSLHCTDCQARFGPWPTFDHALDFALYLELLGIPDRFTPGMN